jgi:ribosomal protein S18 acetylase RimI-like enzyme
MDKMKIEIFTSLNADTLKLVCEFETAIFPVPTSLSDFERELQSKFGVLALIASIDGVPCGYKIGYEQSPKRFYSWVGGVLPTHRNSGVAKALMKKQHELVKEKGFKYISTQTKNEFKEMLILNIRSGFEIIGVRQSLGSETPAILLEKAL